MDITSHIPEPCHSLICDRVGRRYCCIEGDEYFMRSNRVLRRDKRAEAECESVVEVKSFTSKRNRRNGDLG